MSQTYTVNVNDIGDVYWYNEQGQRHRDGGLPACEYASGTKGWWISDQLHRDGGLPAIDRVDGYKAWYVHGKLHREGGLPAIEYASGGKSWYVNDKLHRDGGLPAIERATGANEWWVNGMRLSEKHAKAMSNKCNVSDKVIEIDGKKFKLVEV